MSESANNAGSAPVQSSVGIDYLAKDYASFRRLMLDRLNNTSPDAATGEPADPGTMLVELLAHAADRLSYYQDAVATEAYLSTARLRTSVRRHARLLDYPMHDGCNARAFTSVQITASADGQILPAGTAILTRVLSQPAIVTRRDVPTLISLGAQVFETLHDLPLRLAHNQMKVFISDPTGKETLAVGATSAVLRNDDQALLLTSGDVLIFEETAAADGSAGDPTHRQAVRLTSVVLAMDATTQSHLAHITWNAADALTFELALSRAKVTGNVVLVDHGYTLPQPETVQLPERPLRLPSLAQGPLAWQTQVFLDGRPQTFDPSAAASAAIRPGLAPGSMLRPCISLMDSDGRPWAPQRDLLGSGPHATDFVIEVNDAGTTCLRFGDGVYGKTPQGVLNATYRIGNGSDGNAGAESLYHLVSALPGLLCARNPLPASGGTDPEPIQQVQLHAPYYFQKPERAVTADDYITVLRRLPEIRDAQVSRRYTGSFYTLVLTVQRIGGLPVDADFKSRMRAYLEPYRMAGHDVQLTGPVKVPLAIELTIQPATGYGSSSVLEAVKLALGNKTYLGQKGLFHPDRCVLGQTLYLSQLVSATMAVPGVSFVEVTRFQRWNGTDALAAGVIQLSPLEVAVVDNVPGAPERGQLTIFVRGGL